MKPSKSVEKGIISVDADLIQEDLKNLMSLANCYQNKEIREYFNVIFDMKALLSENFKHFYQITELRKVFVKHAKLPYSMLCFDVATLIYINRSIEQSPEIIFEQGLFPILFSLLYRSNLRNLLEKEFFLLLKHLEKRCMTSNIHSVQIEMVLINLIVNMDYPVYKTALQTLLQSHFKVKADVLQSDKILLITNRLLLGVEDENGQKGPNALELCVNKEELDYFLEGYNRTQKKLSYKIHCFCADEIYLSTRDTFYFIFPLRGYILDVVNDGQSLHWLSNEFTEFFGRISTNVRPRGNQGVERRLMIISMFKPPNHLAHELIRVLKSGRIAEGLAEIPDWKYFALAYGITIVEFNATEDK